VTEALDRESQGDKQPEAASQVASSRVPVIAVSLAALAVIGAATANSLPSFDGFSLPDFNQFSCRASIGSPCRNSAVSSDRISIASLHLRRLTRLQSSYRIQLSGRD